MTTSTTPRHAVKTRPGVAQVPALLSGTSASLLSTAVLAVCSHLVSGSAAAGTNATSHIVHGDAAFTADRPSWRHTGLGYALHHASALVWAWLYEALRNPRTRSPAEPLLKAGVASAVAYGIDYTITPRRMTPGFEHRLPRPAMFAVYAALALGMALPAMLGTIPSTAPGRASRSTSRRPSRKAGARPARVSRKG